MTIIIRVYLLICVSLLLFDVVFLLVQNQRSLVAYRPNRAFERRVRSEIAARRESGSFSAGFESTLSRELSKPRELLTLQGVIEQDAEAREWFRPYVFAQVERYTSREEPERAYYTYIVSTFDFSREQPTPEFVNALMNYLDSDSLYTFSNTMICLYAMGQSGPLLRAMDRVNERMGFYHKKLLVDGLLSARTEGSAFNDGLLKRFDSYTPEMQDCLLITSGCAAMTFRTCAWAS